MQNKIQSPNQNLNFEQNQNQNEDQPSKKEFFSSITVKTLLIVLIFTALTVIIIGGWIYVIKNYDKNETNNKIVKTTNQEIENYYNVLEKKCAGHSCCLSSLKYMRENNYKEVDKNHKCPDGFSAGGIKCESTLIWCEPIENNNEDNIKGDIYSVKEISKILKNNPEFLKNKKIKMRAYNVDGVMGMGCSDYLMLTDYENADLYKKKYDKNLTIEEKYKILRISIIETGQTLILPDNFYPTVYAIYEGHFYDKWAVENCEDGYKKFIIDRKIQEIIPNKNFANLSQTVNNGCLIANGKLIMNPVKVVLNNNVIKVNDILYEPATEERIGKITMYTNERMIEKYNELIGYLNKNKIIIYGGDSYGGGGGYCEEEKILTINQVIRNDESENQKKERLEKLLGSPASFIGYDDMLKNWNFNEKLFYHCPLENEMYKGNNLDCQPPFNTKNYCQEEYKNWINKHCKYINFVD